MTKQNTNLFDFFTKNVPWPTHLTEFILYSGWIKYRYGTLDTLYEKHTQYYTITNIADFEKNDFLLIHTFNFLDGKSQFHSFTDG